MLDKETYENTLKAIMEKGGLDLENEITLLRNDYSERENKAPEENEFETKYNELKKTYIERFFKGDETKPETEEKEEKETEEKEPKYEDLFKEVK